MANKDKDFTDMLKRDDAWHWKENEMLALALSEGDAEKYQDVSKRLKELQPKYKGPINLPEEFGRYMARRADAWNVKEMLSVMAVWSGDKANAAKAMDGIMEAFRTINNESGTIKPVKAYDDEKIITESPYKEGVSPVGAYNENLSPVVAYPQEIDRVEYEKLIAGVLGIEAGTIRNTLKEYTDNGIVAAYNHVISVGDDAKLPQIRLGEFMAREGHKYLRK